jgi:hypothetical protein
MLTPCLETLLTLIYPLRPIFVYITALPAALADLVQAPTPFMYGALRENVDMASLPDHVRTPGALAPAPPLTPVQIAVLDLDANTLHIPSHVAALPARFRNKLLRCISRHAPLYVPPRGRSASFTAAEEGFDVADGGGDRNITKRTLNVLYSSSESSESDSGSDMGAAAAAVLDDVPLLPFAAQTVSVAVPAAPFSLHAAALREGPDGAVSGSPSPVPSPASPGAAAAAVATREPAPQAAAASPPSSASPLPAAPAAAAAAADDIAAVADAVAADAAETATAAKDAPAETGRAVRFGSADAAPAIDPAAADEAESDGDSDGERSDEEPRAKAVASPVPASHARTPSLSSAEAMTDDASEGEDPPLQSPPLRRLQTPAIGLSSPIARRGADDADSAAAAAGSTGDSDAGSAPRRKPRVAVGFKVQFAEEIIDIHEPEPEPAAADADAAGRERERTQSGAGPMRAAAAAAAASRTMIRMQPLRSVFCGVFVSLLKSYREFLSLPDAGQRDMSASFLDEQGFLASLSEDSIVRPPPESLPLSLSVSVCVWLAG